VARADKAEPRHASFSATDVHGTAVTIPASGSPSVLLFIRGGQTLSEHVLEQVQEMSESGMEAHVVVIASGSNASDAAHAYGSTLRWPVIVDADYAIAGSLGVEVWPATLVVQEDGVLVAHIGGAPPSYSVDLGSYLALASGEIDRETLKTRMAEYRLLGDGAGERARWHLQMGRALLEKGSPEEAEQMLNSGLRFQPESVPLRIELVRVLVALKRGPEAQKLLESLPAESFEAHQGELLEGQVMAAMGRWSDARRLAEEVLADAPTNAEARYLLGMVHENAGDWERAAREYRAAMDSGRD
jgi:thioredoxin-like negative regulator of GroEL